MKSLAILKQLLQASVVTFQDHRIVSPAWTPALNTSSRASISPLKRSCSARKAWASLASCTFSVEDIMATSPEDQVTRSRTVVRKRWKSLLACNSSFLRAIRSWRATIPRPKLAGCDQHCHRGKLPATWPSRRLIPEDKIEICKSARCTYSIIMIPEAELRERQDPFQSFRAVEWDPPPSSSHDRRNGHIFLMNPREWFRDIAIETANFTGSNKFLIS